MGFLPLLHFDILCCMVFKPVNYDCLTSLVKPVFVDFILNADITDFQPLNILYNKK